VAFVGAHPFLAERLAEAAVLQHLLPLPADLQGYSSVLKQQTEGSGRFDFVLCYDDGSRLLLEVKNVVAADFPEGGVPLERSKVSYK
jgi:DNA-binding sugar fermentation-stimulating protein